MFHKVKWVILGMLIVASNYALAGQPAYEVTFNLNSNKCLDIRGPTTNNGAPAQIYDCLGANQLNQIVTLNYVSGNYGSGYQLILSNSGKCLDADNSQGYVNGTVVQQWDCYGANQLNQLWQFVQFGNNYQIRSVASGKCLDLEYGDTSNTNKVQIWDCWGDGSNTNQLWNLNQMPVAQPPPPPPPAQYSYSCDYNNEPSTAITIKIQSDGSSFSQLDYYGNPTVTNLTRNGSSLVAQTGDMWNDTITFPASMASGAQTGSYTFTYFGFMSMTYACTLSN